MRKQKGFSFGLSQYASEQTKQASPSGRVRSRCNHTNKKRLPLGRKLSPKVADEGRKRGSIPPHPPQAVPLPPTGEGKRKSKSVFPTGEGKRKSASIIYDKKAKEYPCVAANDLLVRQNRLYYK